jgi:hypothetical protein
MFKANGLVMVQLQWATLSITKDPFFKVYVEHGFNPFFKKVRFRSHARTQSTPTILTQSRKRTSGKVANSRTTNSASVAFSCFMYFSCFSLVAAPGDPEARAYFFATSHSDNVKIQLWRSRTVGPDQKIGSVEMPLGQRSYYETKKTEISGSGKYKGKHIGILQFEITFICDQSSGFALCKPNFIDGALIMFASIEHHRTLFVCAYAIQAVRMRQR